MLRLAVLGLERYILTSKYVLLITVRRVDGDYEQHLEIIESVKAFKERRINERSNVLNRRRYIGSSLTKLKKVQGKKNGYDYTRGYKKRN